MQDQNYLNDDSSHSNFNPFNDYDFQPIRKTEKDPKAAEKEA